MSRHRCSTLTLIPFLCVALAALPAAPSRAIEPPSRVATVIIDGIDSEGPNATGTVGLDESHELIDTFATMENVSAGYANPADPAQITMTRHYGDKYPSYYTQADKDEVDDLTDQYEGGIPRYAAIIAKFCRQVMKRSGAKQVNIVGLSLGAEIGRWMIEKDYEHLASTGKIARFMTAEGVVCGNWPCSQGGSIARLITDNYYADTIDIQHMDYDWIENNLHDPRTEMDNPLYAGILVLHWSSTDDSENNRALTLATAKPNDGVQLYEDTYFHTVTDRSKYFGQPPTHSHIYESHNTAKDNTGIRAGLIAGLTSTRRVRITLLNVKVKDLPESSGQGEVVFGCRVFSPLAQTRYGITEPINQVDHKGHTIDPVSLDENERVTINQVVFDDFILPGETQLRLDWNAREMDFDYIYGISENPLDTDDSISSDDVIVSTTAPGNYTHDTTGWNGAIKVEVIDYPPFGSPNTARNWQKYH